MSRYFTLLLSAAAAIQPLTFWMSSFVMSSYW